MAGSRKDKDRLKETYDRIRKPVPPPSRVMKDKRRELKVERVEREVDQELEDEQE